MPLCGGRPELAPDEIVLSELLPRDERRLEQPRGSDDVAPCLVLVQIAARVAPATERDVSRVIPPDESPGAQLRVVHLRDQELMSTLLVLASPRFQRTAFLRAQRHQLLAQLLEPLAMSAHVNPEERALQVLAVPDIP